MLRKFVAAAIASVILASFLVANYVGFTYSGASPLNTEWDGTSNLVKYLMVKGFKVHVVTDWSLINLGALRKASCGIVFLISPIKPLSPQEVKGISELVSSGYYLVIADEGVYSNELLKELRVPIRVLGNVITVSNSPDVPADIRVGGTYVRVILSYASNLKVWGSAEVLGRVNGRAVAAEYVGRDLKVLVIGDGTVFINYALITFKQSNPYIRLLNAILLNACGGVKGEAVVDAEPYRFRPEGIGVLLSLNYPLTYITASLINPYRYYYALISSARYAGKLIAFIAAVLAITSTLAISRYLLRGLPKALTEVFRRVRGIGVMDESAGRDLLRAACREGLLKEFSNVCGKVDSKELDGILKELSSNPRFREVIIKALTMLREFKESP